MEAGLRQGFLCFSDYLLKMTNVRIIEDQKWDLQAHSPDFSQEAGGGGGVGGVLKIQLKGPRTHIPAS